MESLHPLGGSRRSLRRRLGWREEAVLALLPTLTVLAVLAFLEALSEQRVLFSSLAASAFLIYLDPEHGTNTVRTLVLAHLVAAGFGLVAFLWLGAGYFAGGAAMVATIMTLIFLDAVHPPAVSTSLSFAFRTGHQTNLFLFVLAVGAMAILVVLEQATLWLLARLSKPHRS